MPTVESLLERPKCKVGPCARVVAIKEKTIQGRWRVRNVCTWHLRHPTDLGPAPEYGAADPFAARTCAYTGCPRWATSIGMREGKMMYAKWCIRHRHLWARQMEDEVRRTRDIPNPPRPQASTNAHRPLKYPETELIESMPSNPRKLQKMSTWMHGPRFAPGKYMIQGAFPGMRVVYNDEGYVAWATVEQIRALDRAVLGGTRLMTDLVHLMRLRRPKQYHPVKSAWQGDTTPRITPALVSTILGLLSRNDKRTRLGLDPLPPGAPVWTLTGRTADDESRKVLQTLRNAIKRPRRRDV